VQVPIIRGPLALTVAAVLAAVVLAPSASAAIVHESSVLGRVNGYRAANGLEPLVEPDDLHLVAARYAAKLADTGVLAHNPNLAEQVENWDALAENVAVGPDANAIHRGFVDSPPHRANLLGSFTEIGVGLARRDGALWVVQVFRRPAAVSTPAPPAAPPTPLPAAAPAVPASAAAPVVEVERVSAPVRAIAISGGVEPAEVPWVPPPRRDTSQPPAAAAASVLPNATRHLATPIASLAAVVALLTVMAPLGGRFLRRDRGTDRLQAGLAGKA
jgi:hypothetical protein